MKHISNMAMLACVIVSIATPSLAEIYVSVDKSTQTMSVAVDGQEQYTWAVSTGKPGYDTPNGVYSVNGIHKIWYSKQWNNTPMPYSVFFTNNGHAIHGTKEVNRLGTPASKGCVRLSNENAGTLFELVNYYGEETVTVEVTGSIVTTEYTEPVPEPDYTIPEEPVGPPYVPPYVPPPPAGIIEEEVIIEEPFIEEEVIIIEKVKPRRKWRRYKRCVRRGFRRCGW